MNEMIRGWLQELAKRKAVVLASDRYDEAQRSQAYQELGDLEHELASRLGVKAKGSVGLDLPPIGNKGRNKPLKIWGERR